jgi:hypothetical protein
MKNFQGPYWGRSILTGLLSSLLAVQPCLPAAPSTEQPVSLADLQQELVSATAARQRNRQILAAWFATPRAEKAIRTARLDLQQVKAGIASLNDEDLARLAARSSTAQADFAAGRLTERDLLLILLGIAALILIIVAVR